VGGDGLARDEHEKRHSVAAQGFGESYAQGVAAPTSTRGRDKIREHWGGDW